MLSRLLHLEGNELKRLLPFFGLYFLVFCLLSMADGLSLALFVKRVGAASLPRYYALTAVLNLAVIAVYVSRAERLGSAKTFQLILAMTGAAFLGAYLSIEGISGGAGRAYGLLFAAREVAYTLLVMHFGTFLQDYFTRVELNRVLMVVYSGGRVGGIAGGALLELLATQVGLSSALLACIGISLLTMVGVALVARVASVVGSDADERSDEGLVRGDETEALERDALTSMRGFIAFAYRSPLVRWTSISSLVFMVARWVLNFQYNSYFERHFASDVELAAFMGRYTVIALSLSLGLQLFVMSRLVRAIGLKASNLVYAVLVSLALGANALHMGFGQAVASRALETELRFGMRNPVNQLIVNKLSRSLRVRVRAFSLGVLVPVGTLLGSGLLALLAGAGGALVGVLGVIAGAGYLGSCVGVNGSFLDSRGRARWATREEEPCRSES